MVHAHLVAAVSNGMIVEHVVSEGTTEELFTGELSLDEVGMIAPPAGPGLGISLNEGVLEKNLFRRD
jgi:L-alanine-DL-glutamate epimerase-like enolase superfamily enzyme